MKYLIIQEDENLVIHCDPNELESVIKSHIAEGIMHEGDRVYSLSYLGMVEKKVEFSFKPKEG